MTESPENVILPIRAGIPYAWGIPRRWCDSSARWLQSIARDRVADCPLGLSLRSGRGSTDYPAQAVAIRKQLHIPTDLIIAAWRELFPAERMMFIGGRAIGQAICATSVRDVTWNEGSRVYVRSEPARLHQALLDWEQAGARVLAWIHSHPGTGLRATEPSSIDREQQADLVAVYGHGLVGLIVSEDGWLRVWGGAEALGHGPELFNGNGVFPSEVPHVYRLAVQ